MMKHVSKGVYKRDSIMFYFDGEKEKAIDKVNFCNKCQLERINNRAEGNYICMKCGDCEFVCFSSSQLSKWENTSIFI